MQTTIKPLLQIEKEGILFVDKPKGSSSHRVVNWARRITGTKKIGHTGTLDPLATGLLVLLIGRKYTKMQNQFLKQDKEYQCMAQLGIETETYDTEGNVLNTTDWEQLQHIEEAAVEKILEKFRGKIQQTVPAYSAVKRQGRKLYELARSGEIDLNSLPAREIDIFSLTLNSFEKDNVKQKISMRFTIHCSSGTYIRSLVHDIGQELGVGAVMTELRRTKIGKLALTDALICPVFWQS